MTAKSSVKIAEEKAVTDNTCSQFKAAQDGFTQAIAVLQNQETLVKVAEALSVQNFVGGSSFADVVLKIFNGSGLENLFKGVEARATGNSSSSPTMPSGVAGRR